jgi:anti-sigma factor RsiW
VECGDVRNLLHPFVDGELDLVRHLQIEHHVADCTECADREQGIRQMREALAAPSLRYRAPTQLRSKLESALARESALAPAPVSRPKRRKMMVLVATAAAAVLVAAFVTAGLVLSRPDGDERLVLSRPDGDERLVEQVVAGHVRSLQVAHATDVASSNRHTVKPWFLGKVDFSPHVPDLSAHGYELSGGRLDYLVDHPVAALVYRRRDHLINVFTWAAVDNKDERAVQSIRRQGFHVRLWQQSGMAYSVISDLNPQELDEFVGWFREAAPAQP